MTRHSAGILLYRKASGVYEMLLVHPGGPFWANKDLGAWSLPKGEFDEDEQPLVAAKREFMEEIGAPAPDGEYQSLGEAKVTSNKILHAYTLESDFNLEKFHSQMFEIEWPPKSGKTQEFPEVDKAAWTPLTIVQQKLVKGQAIFIDRLAERLGEKLPDAGGAEQSSLF